MKPTGRSDHSTDHTPTPPTIAAGNVRQRVRDLALAGGSQRSIAAALGIAKSTVGGHLRALVKMGAIVEVRRGAQGRIEYALKPVGSIDAESRGASGPGGPGAVFPVRVHRGGWAFPVRWLGSIVRDAPWESVTEPNGPKKDRDYRLSRDGFGLWLKVGKREATLMVEPPGSYAWTGDEVRSARMKRAAEARRAAEEFAGAFGVRFYPASEAFEFQPTEYAQFAPKAEPFGTPGVSLVWVDGSPGKNQYELETQDVEIAAAFIEAPLLRGQVEFLEHAVQLLVTETNLRLGQKAPRSVPVVGDPAYA